MREARLIIPTTRCFRCLTKVDPQTAPLSSDEKLQLVILLTTGAKLFQIELWAYCVYDDYCDFLIEKPKSPQKTKPDTLLENLLAFHSDRFKQRHQEAMRRPSANSYLDSLYRQWSGAAGDPAQYLKSVKQGFSLWRKDKTGDKQVVWKDRYKMMPVVANRRRRLELAIEIGASPYLIDSPLPVEYPFCSFADWQSDKGDQRAHLAKLLQADSWSHSKTRVIEIAETLTYKGTKMLPKHYGSKDLDELREANRQRVAQLPTKKDKLAALKKTAARYQRLFDAHPVEFRDEFLAENAPDLLDWARKIRYRRYADKVGQTHIDILDKHGFEWTGSTRRSKRTSWSKRFAELESLQAQKGRSPKASIPEEASLAKWLAHQIALRKNGKLPEDRARKLASLSI